MGTCCAAHLAAIVRAYAPNAENGAVTVTILRTPPEWIDKSTDQMSTKELGAILCVYCKAPGEFTVSYFPKKE